MLRKEIHNNYNNSVTHTQYWKVVIADNYGDNATAVLAEIQFFGVGALLTLNSLKQERDPEKYF